MTRMKMVGRMRRTRGGWMVAEDKTKLGFMTTTEPV